MVLKKIFLSVFFLLFAGSRILFAQPDQEWKLTTYGVRDGIRTVVNGMVQDSTGYIWFATFDGLIRYDGQHFVTYHNDFNDSLSLGANYVTKLMVDRNGKLWAGFATGIIARYEPSTNNFRNFRITDDQNNVIQEMVSMLYADDQNNIWVGVTRNGVFRSSDQGKTFTHFDLVPGDNKLYDAELTRIYNSAYAARQDKKGRLWFATHDGLYRFDNILQAMMPVRKATFTTKGLRDDLFNTMLIDPQGRLWLGSWSGGISSYDPAKNEWQKFKFNNKISPTTNIITSMDFCSDDCIWLTSADEGFGYFDIGESKFSIFLNEKEYLKEELPAKQSFQVMKDRDNNLWISHARGLTKIEQRAKLFYFEPVNVAHSDNYRFYQLRKVWTDKRKRFQLIPTYYADGVQLKDLRTGKSKALALPMMKSEEQLMLGEDVLEDSKGKIWVLSRDYLQYLDTNSLQLKMAPVQPPHGERSNQYYSMLEDSDGNFWISTHLQGVYVLNPEKGIIRHFHMKGQGDDYLPFNSINALVRDSKNRIWISSRRGGLNYFDPETKKMVSVNLQRYGNRFSNKVRSVLEDKKGFIWFGTENGMLQTDPADNFKILAHYTAKDGLVGDLIYHSALDSAGNVWVVTVSSVAMIIPDRKQVISFGEEDGYANRWNVALDISPESGSRIEIPTTAGYFYFNPNYMVPAEHKTRIRFAELKVNDKPRFVDGLDTLTLHPGENFFTIDFNVIDFNDADKIQYAYKLDGFNDQWIQAGNHSFASYTNLPGGFYTFRVKGGVSQIDERAPESTIVVHIIDPVYKRPWFLVTMALAFLAGFILLIRNRNKKITEQRGQIEAEQIINYFATSMNDKKTVEDILWDVTKNCIGKMHFEDCVIYLMDEEKNELNQVASYGPKTDENNRIISPLQIPVGKGIVGSVALSGKPEIIGNTSKDPRYIIDDKQRFSEITVPIISDGKVLGIIDCEHSGKHFFTGRHLMMLTTIASLCANKIIRAKAEEERITAQDELSEAQQKMKDMEMQALRAQMNPHFIFNCLNSINRYIIKSDQATASLYLTRFAKLIRLILDNSNSKNVVLGNELEALKLYIEMEALRFEQKFSYSIEVDANVNTDSIEVPPLIIQPYVENAIWHGLLHKKEAGHLSIRVGIRNGNLLECIIEDNGVGREKAREMKSKTATTRKSLGMKLTENRLSLLNSHATTHATVTIEDLVEQVGISKGTKVVLTIPIEH